MDFDRLRTQEYSMLLEACKQSNLAEVERIIKEEDTSPNSYDDNHKYFGSGETPLILACRKNDTDLINLLLSLGADVNLGAGSRFPLTEAWQGPGGQPLFDRLLYLDADINAEDEVGNNPLIAAAVSGFVDLTEDLISRGSSVNETRGKKHPLNVACKHGHVDVVDKLLAAGSTVNFLDRNGETALTNAISKQHIGIIDRLVIHGVDLHQVDKYDWSPFHISCAKESTEIVDRLLGLGVDINLRGPNGATPLMMASWNDRPGMVKFLLDNGADRDLVDNHGKKAIDHAFSNKVKQVLEA